MEACVAIKCCWYPSLPIKESDDSILIYHVKNVTCLPRTTGAENNTSRTIASI